MSEPKENYCLYCCREKAPDNACPHCNNDGFTSPSDANHHLAPGTLLRGGDYMLGRVLGAGGFGVTYLAVDVQLGMRLAIKELLPTSIATRVSDGVTVAPVSEGAKGIFRSSVEGFLREAKTLVPFNEHPNIVSVVKFFEENGTAYLVMPYLEGQTLDEYLESRGGWLKEEEALYITQCVLDALRATHKQDLLHRDVKPHNVYLTKDGPIKLIDFGSARQVVGEQSKSMSAVVTDGYAPFEQYQTRGKQGPWTDLYAVGALLYRMLTGENPPTATDRMMDDGLKSEDEIAKHGANPQVCQAVVKALAVKPAERFQSVEEMEVAFKGEVETPPQEPPYPSPPNPPPEPEPQESPTEKNEDSRGRQPSEPDEPGENERDERFRKRLLGIAAALVLLMVVGVVATVSSGRGGSPENETQITEAAIQAEVTEPEKDSETPVKSATAEIKKRVQPKGVDKPDLAELTGAFRRKKGRIHRCFEKHPASVEQSSNVSVLFSVLPSGKVQDVQLSPESLNGTSLGGCLLGVSRSTSFPPQSEPISFRIPLSAKRVKP